MASKATAVQPPKSCQLCKAKSTEPMDALTWVLEIVGDTWNWTCVDCTRAHVRDMEGRLDVDYWDFG